MRAFEFLRENSTSGATSAGNVATVAQPQGGIHRRGFFGGDPKASIYHGNPMAVIRREDPTTEKKKKKDRKK